MNDLGKLLRQARETANLTLAQAEADTHIRATYLAALEEGHWEALPDAVYSRGLAANYARYLGLDDEQIQQLLGSEPKARFAPLRSVGSHQPLAEPLYLRERAWIGALVVMVLIAVLAFLTWWYWPILRPWGRWLLSGAPLRTRATSTATNSLVIVVVATSSPTPSEQALASEPTALLAVTPSEPTPTSAALPLPTPGPTETPTPGAATATATPTRPSGMAVRVETSADAWLRAVADGTPVFEGTLSGGEALDWQARQSFQMLTGNAGGTRLLINGQDVGTLGDSGDVVEGTWLWQGGQVVTPTPEG